ncbi:LOW QUALITY PROTEIN: glycosyltransferase [Brevundimonas abyssalis TAR-001]|uniref:Glycosyltransferase n=1 Tax=Brevundimonas abyssalis TAR-001 TaxID=1391729 RepID=A0A8E0KLG7_9CAUL|nr:LOW QUALITY PROTEIN: glycosyltransferase [Brevundimonas abyssalis TAR-001]
MRIVLATDAWEPQMNGVVRTLTRTVAECRAMGHEVEVIEPGQFKTIPCPTYPEIRLALGAEEEIRERLRAFEPEAVHISTEGPIGIATRRICVEWKLPFTTSYHTKFPEYVSARFPIPVQVGYAYMKWFHKPSGRLMVATPTLRDELTEHGFRNVSPWSRGVDTTCSGPIANPSTRNSAERTGRRPFWLNVGRVAVEKNIESFLELDLPGTKIIVGDGPAKADLESRYPEAKFLGARFGEELARCFADADVFVFPSWTDTFGLVILEAMAAGTPVAAYPAHGPIDIIPGSGAGAIDDDLKTACLEALKMDPETVRAYAEKFSWRASAEQFVENLQPYPEPQKTRLWRRLRRLARVRGKAA